MEGGRLPMNMEHLRNPEVQGDKCTQDENIRMDKLILIKAQKCA